MAAWPEPGWYFEPGGAAAPRWWDGQAWGPHGPTPSTPQAPSAPTGPVELDRFGLPAMPSQLTSVLEQTPPGWVVNSPSAVRTVAVTPMTLVGCVAAAVGLFVAGALVWNQVRPSSGTSRPSVAAGAPAGDPTQALPTVPQDTDPAVPPVAAAGHPVFRLATPPPQGFEGDARVLSAGGVGPLATPTFSLHGGVVSGSMGQQGDGVYFYLVPVGGHATTQPTATCNDTCASGGWGGGALPAGTYRLVVKTAKADTWTFDLEETLVQPLSLTVGQDTMGTTLEAHGMGSRQTRVFAVSRSDPAPGKIRLSGDFSASGPTHFWLVPKGQALRPASDVTLKAPAGGGGGFALDLPGPGSYYLVVQTGGPWKFSFTAS